MKRFVKSAVIATIALTMAGCAFASGPGKNDRHGKSSRSTFATLPDGVTYPEGIAANPETGDIYVGTFSFGGNNTLLRYSKRGRLLAQIDFAETPLLGLAFNAFDNKVYICNTGDLVGGTSRIQRIDADFDESTVVENVADIPHIGAPAARTVDNPDGSADTVEFGNNAAAPNAMVFDDAGKLYISDSFQGAIFSIDDVANCTPPCDVATVVHDSLLATAGFPPFGANGLALDEDGSTLFIANTGDDRILTLNLETSEIAVLAESINGADGLAMGSEGNLLVAANQADHIMVLNQDGRVISKLGAFSGIREEGSPRGLLFPASLVVVHKTVYVTNLALPLTSLSGDEPEEDVTLFTVSTFRMP